MFQPDSIAFSRKSPFSSYSTPWGEGDVVYHVAKDGQVKRHAYSETVSTNGVPVKHELETGIINLTKALLKTATYKDMPKNDRILAIFARIEAHVEDMPLNVGDEYPADLINTGDVMAEFTLIEGRLVVLSNMNGDQPIRGEYAIVRQYFRPHGSDKQAGTLMADNLTWVQACDWCKNHIDRLNTTGTP